MAKHLWYERHRVIHVLPNLSPRPVMALELGSHPKPTQIADALVYVFVSASSCGSAVIDGPMSCSNELDAIHQVLKQRYHRCSNSG